MPPETPVPPLEFDRHFRRAVWITLTLTILGGGLVYSWKAQDDRSAFVRWRHQVLQLFEGENVYEKMAFPNPPIMPIVLYPLMSMPKVAGAVTWYFLKAIMAGVSAWLCFRLARADDRPMRSYIQAGIWLFSFRPILSDLHHGNINLLILLLVVLMLYSWRNGKDVLAGSFLAMAISFKVTPGLFLPYFAYKRQWKAVAACLAGLAIFLFFVPSAVLGTDFNNECLSSWFKHIISPYVMKAEVKGPAEINQSLSAVLTRLMTKVSGNAKYDPRLQVNLVSWSPRDVGVVVKGVMLGLVGLLGLFCRTPTRNRFDPRLLGEFSLVVLTMLFVSERSWKHHYVTMLLPYTYLVYRVGTPFWPKRVRVALLATLVASALMVVATSTEVGGLFANGQGHEIAQAYGLFCWAGMLLYAATAWCVVRERCSSPFPEPAGSEASGSPSAGAMPAPHLPGLAAVPADRRAGRAGKAPG
ncbi:MAG: glycosyltransferase family 87 protein [Isosphaeraceae bacterium]